MSRSLLSLVSAAALAFAACAPADSTSSLRSTSTTQALEATNGEGLNGEGLNGEGLNGEGLNGEGLNGNGLGNHLVSVNYGGALRDNLPLQSVVISGSQLLGHHGSTTYSGQQMVGARFNGTSDTGAEVQLNVANVTQEGAPNDDTWDYEVWYSDPDDDTSSWPLCTDSSGNPTGAYAIDGHWSYAQGVTGGGAKVVDGATFTFACKGRGAIGKCVGWGYHPWASFGGVSLDRYHQACVRMVRADYCGDGTPHTTDGRLIDLYDGLGVQTDTDAWNLEAEWDDSGARCVTSTTRGGTGFSCYAAKYSATCGSLGDFNAGTLLMNEIPPPT